MFTEDASWVHANMFVQPARAPVQQQPVPRSVRRGHKRRYDEGPGADTDPRAPRPLSSPHSPPMPAHGPPLGHPAHAPERSVGMFRGNGHHDQEPLAHEDLGPARSGSEQERRDAAWRAAQRSSGSGSGSVAGSGARPSRQGQDTVPFPSRQSQAYKKPRLRQEHTSRPTPSSQFPHSSQSSQPSQFYHPSAASASGSQHRAPPVATDFAHFEFELDQDQESMGEPMMRVGPCPSTADSPPPAYSTFQLSRMAADREDKGHQPSSTSRSDRRSKQRSDRTPRPQTEVAAAAPSGRTHHKVTVLMEDQRPGRGCVLAEVFVFISESGGQLFVDAHDISDELQKSPQRIEGPAKLYTFRGKWKQYFLRVGVFYDPTEPVDSTHQSLMLRVDKEHGPKALLLDVFIEEDTSARPPSCWQCGAPCQPDALAEPAHPRVSRAGTREQEELMRATSRARSTSEFASPRSSYNADRPASTKPVESRHHSRRGTVQDSPLTATSSRSQAKAPAASVRRPNPVQQQQSSSWLDVLATQAQNRISPVSDEDDDDDDDLGDFGPNDIAPLGDAGAVSARTPAFGASGFGASFFEKYSKQGTSFAPPSAEQTQVNVLTGRLKPSEPDPVDAAVIEHLRNLLEEDPRWERFEGYRTEPPQFKFLREMCYWVHAQVTRYSGKTVDVSPELPSVTITTDHVYQAISFFPENCRDILDKLIVKDQQHGPNGTEGEDSEVMAYLEEVPAVETELAIRNYHHTVLSQVPFRIARAKAAELYAASQSKS